MLDMRFRLHELAKNAGITSAYQLEKRADRKLSISTCNRLWAAGHNLKRIDTRTLQALCDIFDVDTNILLERERKRR